MIQASGVSIREKSDSTTRTKECPRTNERSSNFKQVKLITIQANVPFCKLWFCLLLVKTNKLTGCIQIRLKNFQNRTTINILILMKYYFRIKLNSYRLGWEMKYAQKCKPLKIKINSISFSKKFFVGLNYNRGKKYREIFFKQNRTNLSQSEFNFVLSWNMLLSMCVFCVKYVNWHHIFKWQSIEKLTIFS